MTEAARTEAEAMTDKIATRTEQTYLALLLLPHNSLRTRLQPELAACRDAIAFSEETDAEEIQNRYEAWAEKLRPQLWHAPLPGTREEVAREALRPFAEWADRNRSAVSPEPMDELIRLARKACDDFAALPPAPMPEREGMRAALLRAINSFDTEREKYSRNADDPKFNECQKEIWASLANEKADDLRVLRKVAALASHEKEPKP